jgi:HSP20 family protein
MPSISLRRSPWRSPLSTFGDRNRDLFSTMFENQLMPESVGMMPAVEIEETDDAYICNAELPGLSEKDVTVSFDDDALTIEGEKRDEREKKEGRRFHVWERTYGKFERSFTFPARVDAERITADFKDGVLSIRLPKAENGKGRSRRIAINAR